MREIWDREGEERRKGKKERGGGGEREGGEGGRGRGREIIYCTIIVTDRARVQSSQL